MSCLEIGMPMPSLGTGGESNVLLGVAFQGRTADLAWRPGWFGDGTDRLSSVKMIYFHRYRLSDECCELFELSME